MTSPYSSSIDSPQYSSHPAYVLPSQPSHLVVSTQPMITRAKSNIYKQKTYLTATQDLEPINVKAALVDLKWHHAMKEEFQALERNSIWTLVPTESTTKIVGNKWVFQVKHNSDGSISKYKAKLVEKRFHKTDRVDFFEIFSPVVKPSIVQIVLSLAFMNHWPIHQLDVKNAFINGVLTEEVFMHQPKGFIIYNILLMSTN